MSPESDFNYTTAFSRNLGWVTAAEQDVLRDKCIAIAGMGGVGGRHLLTAVRAGIGRFHIGDFDRFETANFNRQAGASVSHLGELKVDVLSRMAWDINPTLTINQFHEAIDAKSVGRFLEGADLFLDGLDFFALEARRQIFAACRERNIPAITAAPLGMGAAWLLFQPGRMSFEDYFCLENHNAVEQMIRFAIGLAPRPLQMRYLVDPSCVDLVRQRVPSTPMACDLCAGIAVTSALKILLDRGPVLAAPHSLHFDAYRQRFVRSYRPGGNRHPLQRLGLFVLRRKLLSAGSEAQVPSDVLDTSDSKGLQTLPEKILDLARWAPSGDNLQPWRFKIHSENRFSVLAHQVIKSNIYDLAGWCDQVSLGTLLENIAIAASAEGQEAHFTPEDTGPHDPLQIDVTLTAATTPNPHPLLPFMKSRATQRRCMRTTPLKPLHQAALEEAVLPGYEVLWFESKRQKKQMARILSQSSLIRLTIPEAYSTHKRMIEWRTRFSRDRIPDQAIGLDPLTLSVMRWLMKSWRRIRFANLFLAGTLPPRLQLDYLPARFCAGHFILLAANPPRTAGDYLSAGRAVQRFWLTATQEQIHLQPQLGPLMFSYYARNGVAFTEDRRARERAEQLAAAMENLLGADRLSRAVFMGRVGYGAAPTARSLRKPLADLLVGAT